MRLLTTITLLALSRLLTAQCNFPVSISPIPALCNGDGDYQLTATPAGGAWSGNQITASGLVHLAALFGGQSATYIYTDSTCTDTVTAAFQVLPAPNVNAGTDFTIVCGNTAHLNGSYTAGTNISALWSTSNGHITGTAGDMNTPIDAPGVYVLTAVNAANGCARRDTVVCYPYLPSFPHSEFMNTVCQGDSVFGYSESGTYYDNYPIGAPCDSFRVLHLSVLPPLRDSITASTCAGVPVEGYGLSGTYRDTFPAANGCDSIRLLDLTVLPTVATSLSATTCDPTLAGIFQNTYTAANGCDSTVTTAVALLPSSDTLIVASICNGSFYENYGISGTYTDVFSNQYGCDSTRTLQLTVQPLPGVTAEIQPDHGAGDGAITLTPAGGAQPFQFLWSTGATTPVLTGLSGGSTYTLTLTDANGCSTILEYIVPLSVGAASPAASRVRLSVSPNPARAGEPVRLLLDTPAAGLYRVAVYDAAGRLQQERPLDHPGGATGFTLVLHDGGWYVLQLSDAGGRSVRVRIAVLGK